MERPLEIAFHNLPPSEALEAEIRKRVAKLEKFFPRLIACRVSVEALHNQHQTGNVYEVHIVLSVPGRDIAVSREPHKAKQRYANPDAYVSVREAFEAAERQLAHFKERRREAPASPDSVALTGQVTLIQPGDDHGFILTNTGTQLYFHRDSVTDARFEDLREGDVVHYVEEESDSGPVATKVRLGNRQGES
jgi:ribosomal subunit interface protein